MIIKNGNVFTSEFKFKNLDIAVQEGKITGLGQQMECSDQEVIDAQGLTVIPGFVDIHTHGAYGNDFTNIDDCDLDEISAFYASKGVTSFLATTMTESREHLLKVLSTLAKVTDDSLKGSRMAGIHLEGPFISPKALGCQPPECVQKPSAEMFDEYYAASEGKIKIVTLAPEVEGSAEAIKHITSLGVVCSVGHTKATYKEAVESIKAGITHATHTFNAMTGLHHREPGVVGAVFDTPDITAEIISDLIHVNPAVIRILYKIKGVDHVVGITDSMSATGMKDGTYKLGPVVVHTKDGIATLEDGTLAGSTLTMDKALKNMVRSVGIPLEDAVKILTYNPARVIKADDIGIIKEGCRADFAILDKDFNVKYTIVGGKVVYRA